MAVNDTTSPYSNGPAARMVLVMSGLAYIAVGGCWFWAFRAYPALALVAFGLVPLAAGRSNSRPMVRCFLLGCCLSVFYFALEFTRAMFRQYKASLHPLFWAFPIFAALLHLRFGCW